MSMLDTMVSTKDAPLRRVEVIAGVERRRSWSDDEKARILEQTLMPGVVISEVARRNGLSPQQLFTWRRQARRMAEKLAVEAPVFVPAVVDDGVVTQPAAVALTSESKPAPVLELEIGGSSVWIWREAQIDLVTAVVRALKDNR